MFYHQNLEIDQKLWKIAPTIHWATNSVKYLWKKHFPDQARSWRVLCYVKIIIFTTKLNFTPIWGQIWALPHVVLLPIYAYIKTTYAYILTICAYVSTIYPYIAVYTRMLSRKWHERPLIQYPFDRSILEKIFIFVDWRLVMKSSMFDIGYGSNFVIASSFLESMQNLLVPSFFLTNTNGALHSEFEGSITSIWIILSASLCTSFRFE